jgi:hypothetical protein
MIRLNHYYGFHRIPYNDLTGVDIKSQITLSPISPTVYSVYEVRSCIYFPAVKLAYLDIHIQMGTNSNITANTTRIMNITGKAFTGVILGTTINSLTLDNQNQYGLIGQLSSNKLFLTPYTDNDFKSTYNCYLAGVVRCV